MIVLSAAMLMLFGTALAEIHYRRHFAVQRSVLHTKYTFREVLAAILLMIPSAGTMLLTYFGISMSLGETGTGVVEKGLALAFSLSIGIFAWIGWFYLFGLLYHLKGTRLASSIAAGIIYISTLAAIDAPFNMLALSGAAATQISLVDTADSYESRKDDIVRKSSAVRALLPAIRAQEARFKSLAADEVAHGTQSGKKGPGKVSSGFLQIGDLLGTLAAQLETGLSQASGIENEIAEEFATLKAQAFRPGDIRARMEAAAIATDRIDDRLSRLSQYDFSASIEITLRALENIFPAPTAADSEFGRVQNVQLAIIADMGKPVAAALREGLASLGDDADGKTEFRKFRPLSPHDAIFVYWRKLIPQWCAAFFIDFAPAALLIILIAAYRQDQRDGPPPGPRAPEFIFNTGQRV